MTVGDLFSDLPGLRSDKEFHAAMATLERHTALLAAGSFAERCEAMDAIEFHLIGALDSRLFAGEHSKELHTLRSRAVALHAALEAMNEQMFSAFRNRIRAGRYTRAALPGEFRRHSGGWCGSDMRRLDYDGLDLFLNGLVIMDQMVQVNFSAGLKSHLFFPFGFTSGI